jgi:type III secretion protein R
METGQQLGDLIALLAALSVLPFLLVILTSFAKIVVVLSLLRQALGTQQVPPNTVITGLALILTLHVMYPTIESIRANEVAEEDARLVASEDFSTAERILVAVEGPMVSFLERNSSDRYVDLFARLRAVREVPTDDATNEPAPPDEGAAAASDPAEARIAEVVNALTVTAPAFVLTEISEAFQIAFLIFIPFLVVDLVVANILLAMGMHMMSPVTISMPIKLLLFVVVAGWEVVVEGLVLGYA